MQSAYRKGHSTETTLAKVCSDIVTAMDKGHHVLLALLDLSAAFDTVDHGILLEWLSMSFSERDGVLDRLRSYLTERYYTVRHQGTESTRRVYLRCPSGLGTTPSAVCFIHGRTWKNCRRTWRQC